MRKFLLIIGVVSLLSCSSNSQSNGGTTDLTVTAFKAKLEELPNEQIVDVRTPDEWETGVLKNASKANWFDANFEDQIAHLDKNKPVMVYCAAGGRSAKAMHRLSELGFTEVYNMEGGMGAWSESGFETVK